ncbi:MAG TPA: hypothetical protein VLS93_16655 [Anaeromyxobacteraceae bacterium]|nr:hypothetical protein [Anaeromyxobacteraceae bacterium]
MTRTTLTSLATLAAVAAALAATPSRAAPRPDDDHRATVERVASMVSDAEARRLASRHGLDIVNVLWEDTGRWQGSSLGPNISDVTIEVVAGEGGQRKLALMPVLRFPNFADRTADVRLDRVFVRVGNERAGAPERVVSLRDLLADPSRFLSFPDQGRIVGGSLLAPRDTHALVSAQAAFLPVPRRGRATFHPVIFNYQSTAGNPAVLSILVTRQGTSVTVVDNARDTVGGASWGQRLFFNAGGERAPLTAERLSDVRDRGTTSNGESAASLGEDANLLMLVQVPLRRREPPRRALAAGDAMEAAPAAPSAAKMARAAPDLEVAVLGHGPLEGPFTELAGLTLERDPRFPVRVTVQFYQATSSAEVGEAGMARLASLVEKVYAKGDFVGSLVVPGPGDPRRPTAWDGASPPPPDASWWDFPGLVERSGTPPIGIF